jgi:predicted nucleotidyltransferase
MDLLRKAADILEQRFLCPVYLVGSFERKYREASDIDIVMIASDDRIKRLCGEIVYNDKRFRFNRKQKLWIEQFIHDFDIDFKIQTEKEAFDRVPRTKLGKYVWMPEDADHEQII